MRFWILILLIISSSFARANDLTIYVDSPIVKVRKDIEPICLYWDVAPEFPGGEEAMYKYLAENIKYPKGAGCINGNVYIQFVIEINGAITNVNCPRGLTEEINQQAIGVIKKMPKWKPGEQRGKKVRVKYTLPIKYRLKQ